MKWRCERIPRELIKRAKTRVEHDKIVLDRTIAALQKEKSNILEQSRNLSSARAKADATSEALEKTNEKIQAKLVAYQELFDHNTRRIQLGRRIEGLTDAYFFKKQTKKAVVAELTKLIETETARRAEKQPNCSRHRRNRPPKKRKRRPPKKKQPLPPLLRPIRPKNSPAPKPPPAKPCWLRKKKRKNASAKPRNRSSRRSPPSANKRPKNWPPSGSSSNSPSSISPSRPGDRVRLAGGYSVGTVDRLEKGIAYIDYGWFITQAPIAELELVRKRNRAKSNFPLSSRPPADLTLFPHSPGHPLPASREIPSKRAPHNTSRQRWQYGVSPVLS